MRTIHLFAHRDENTFVQGVNAANPAGDLRIAQNDTLELVIHSVARNRAVPALTPFTEQPLDFSSIRASIGSIDASPTSGSFKLTVQGDVTPELVWPSDLSTPALLLTWKTTVLNALKALASVANAVELLDSATTPAHFFFFRWTNPANTAEIEVVENKLAPWTEDQIIPSTDAEGGLTQLVKMAQFPAKIATDFTRPLSPVVTVSETRPGAVGTNAEQTLHVPTLATGSFSLAWDGASTKTMAVATVTAASIAAALNAIVADGATAPQFRCEERPSSDGRRFAVEFIGALAASAQDALGIAMHDQVSLPWAVGTLTLAGNVAIERALAGAASVDLTLELVITDEHGEETFLRTVIIQNDMTSPSTVTSAEQAGALVTIIREVHVDAGLGTAFAETSAGIAFTVPSGAVANAFAFTHNLGEWGPIVAGIQKVSDSPEEWIQIPDDRYEARSLTLNTTRISLPFDVNITDPADPLHASRFKFFFAGRTRQIQVFNHGHTWAEVRQTLPSGQTLAAKLAAIDAAISGMGGGAAIPGSSLIPGSVAPAALDLTALANALLANARFVELLRLFALDETFIRNLITRLCESTTLSELRTTLFTALITKAQTSTELQAALMAVLSAAAGFQEFLYAQLVAALAGGAQPPGHVFTMPDVDLYSPPPSSIVVSGITLTEFRGLPIAYQTTIAGGNVSGVLAPGSAGTRYTCTAAAFAPENEARAAQTFATGDLIIWNGNFYQKSKAIGTAWYPVEFEHTVIEAFMDELRFPPNSILTLNGTLQTQLDSPRENRLRARWRLALEVGTPTAESGEQNLNAFTWQSAGTHILQIGPELAQIPLQITITRGLFNSTLTWAYKVNGRSITSPSTPTITSGSFVFRIKLTQFDTENNTTPRGAVRCKVLRPGGLVVATT